MDNVKALEMREISKSFGGVKALSCVDYSAYKGKVNVLMGENGAGKSTLMRILVGATPKDAGPMIINGKEVHIRTPFDAINHKIAMIYQELNLIPEMTVEENIFIGRELATYGVVNRRELIERTRKILERYDIQIDPSSKVCKLSLAEQQMVEIVKALASDAEIIVMDEPTSSLTDVEVRNLFRIVRQLNESDVTVIYISHRMDEVFEIGHYITVMRDGSVVGEWPISEVSRDFLITNMVGREIQNVFPKVPAPIGDVLLEVKDLTYEPMFRNVSFTLRRGEILGMSGLIGAGRTEVCMSIFGALPHTKGEIWLNGEAVNIISPTDAIRQKIAYVPEDRKALALDLHAYISNNITLGNMDQVGKHSLVDRKKEKDLCEQMVNKLRVKTPTIYQEVGNLSGGNQQKVVLAKWLARDLDVLILDEPTRGIDVGSKEEIHRLICQLANQGMGIILISSELPEVLAMSDRILVMYEGNVQTILDAKDASQEMLMSYAVNAQTDK